MNEKSDKLQVKDSSLTSMDELDLFELERLIVDVIVSISSQNKIAQNLRLSLIRYVCDLVGNMNTKGKEKKAVYDLITPIALAAVGDLKNGKLALQEINPIELDVSLYGVDLVFRTIESVSTVLDNADSWFNMGQKATKIKLTHFHKMEMERFLLTRELQSNLTSLTETLGSCFEYFKFIYGEEIAKAMQGKYLACKAQYIATFKAEIKFREKELERYNIVLCPEDTEDTEDNKNEDAFIDFKALDLSDAEDDFYLSVIDLINKDVSPHSTKLENFFYITSFNIRKIQYVCSLIHELPKQVNFLLWVLKEARQYQATHDYEAETQGEDDFVKQIEVEYLYRKNQLEESLKKENAIEENKPAQESGEKQIEPIQWLGTKEQFAAMINVLCDSGLVTPDKKYEKFKQHFIPKDNSEWGDLSGKAVKLFESEKDGKPRKKVKALETALKTAINKKPAC